MQLFKIHTKNNILYTNVPFGSDGINFQLSKEKNNDSNILESIRLCAGE